MTTLLNGATRLYFVVGDPIDQVKSPEGVSKALQQKNLNAICIPAHVDSKNLCSFYKMCRIIENIDGIIVTVPHKIQSAAFCDRLSERSKFLGSVNVIVVTKDGFEGDMLDGIGYVSALKEKGCVIKGKRVLLCGLGGAGGAIAHALALSGVGELAIFDNDEKRQDTMIERLNALDHARITKGSRNLSEFDIAINATPTGMKTTDPLPFDIETFPEGLWACDVITKPIETAWITTARKLGSNVVTGMDMFNKVRDLMIDFLIERKAPL